MIYVFEDDERDPLPQLFIKAYDKRLSDKFIYTRGNGNVYNKVETLLLSTDDTIVVYLDTVPGNLDTRRIYTKLSNLSVRNGNRVIVLPVICSEYYFIKSVEYENVITSQDDLRICIDRKPYFISQLLNGESEKKYCSSYEKYCKLILKKAAIDCIRNSRDNGKNVYFRWYYNQDCKCGMPFEDCKDKQLAVKSMDFLNSFPCVPVGSAAMNGKVWTLDELWNIHRNLVNEHNKLCEALMEAEPDINKKNMYKLIRFIA